MGQTDGQTDGSQQCIWRHGGEGSVYVVYIRVWREWGDVWGEWRGCCCEWVDDAEMWVDLSTSDTSSTPSHAPPPVSRCPDAAVKLSIIQSITNHHRTTTCRLHHSHHLTSPHFISNQL